jgi:hypothetical protein
MSYDQHKYQFYSVNNYNMSHCFKTSTRGVVALFAVLIISAGTLLLASNTAWLGLGELESAYTMHKGEEARALADGCIENALQRLRYDNNYGVGAGTLSFSFDNGTCTLDIADRGGSMRTIDAVGIVGVYRKKEQATVTASGTTVDITNWRELSS